ncbi:MAG: 3,4-dihydroxy-2-butanone-4-phosphate synthase [Myxococcaceae bacterium]
MSARSHDPVKLVERALRDIRRGRMVVLTDDETRENEGDLVMAAEKVTPKAINFMATHARGLICLSMSEERIRQLALPMMVHENTSSFETAFTVSIEAARGVSTGISAADRAHTIRTAVAPNAKPTDLVRPGHVFPLRARAGGVLVRTGQTEGSVDLARLAGLFPAGVICEVMNADGTMARQNELARFARRHRLTLLSVADIIRYRLQREPLVRRVHSGVLRRAGGAEFVMHTYASDADPVGHLALVRGQIRARESVLTRVHRACLVGDVFSSAGCHCGEQLERALDLIDKAGGGVVVYLRREPEAGALPGCTHDAQKRVSGRKSPDPSRLREFGVGAQILRDLGLRKLRLLTDNPKRIVGLESYQLQVVAQVPLTAGRRSAASRRGGRL